MIASFGKPNQNTWRKCQNIKKLSILLTTFFFKQTDDSVISGARAPLKTRTLRQNRETDQCLPTA